MKLGSLCFAITLFTFGNAARSQVVHTPKPSSPERQAICDAARSFVIEKYATGKLPQPIVFRIGHFSVSGDYANMEAIPIFKNGREIDSDLLPDIGYNFCLKRNGGAWIIVADLSRSDVPDASEMAVLRRNLTGFPRDLLTPDWQRLLNL
jgi:hypothetical protein